MYLNKKEVDKVLGLLTIEFSEKEIIYLFKSQEENMKFRCNKEELIENESILESLIINVPKESLIKEIKQIRPDLSFQVNKIIKW